MKYKMCFQFCVNSDKLGMYVYVGAQDEADANVKMRALGHTDYTLVDNWAM